MNASERFFQNQECPYFPCHKQVDETDFNCLFCFCPLYALGRACGGDCRYTAQGRKDCSGCALPHRPENYERVLARYGDIMAVAAKIDREGLPHEL